MRAALRLVEEIALMKDDSEVAGGYRAIEADDYLDCFIAEARQIAAFPGYEEYCAECRENKPVAGGYLCEEATEMTTILRILKFGTRYTVTFACGHRTALSADALRQRWWYIGWRV
jgi:hypothetical protein